MIRAVLKASLLVLVIVMSTAAQAELRIDITRDSGQAVPIAIAPFAWLSDQPMPADMADIVSTDLRRSGRFAPLAVNDMLQQPSRAEDIDFGDWRILGTEVIAIGRISDAPDGGWNVEFEVFDVLKGQSLLKWQLPATERGFRATSHLVADKIFEQITGIPGIAATRIAYVNVTGSGENPLYRLIVADSDGENVRVVADSPEPLMSPAWSPDGSQLAYVSFENDRSEIYVQTLRTGERRRVSSRSGVNGSPAWSPDGRKLAITLSQKDGNLDLYSLDLDTQVLTRLTRSPGIDTEAAWSPDGAAIYFTSDRSGRPQIYRVPADGGRASRITFEGNYNARARVAPNGESLAVVHNDRGNYRIAVVGLLSAYTQVLTDGSLDESPSFAPNGQQVIYATREGGRGILATVSVDGRLRERLTAPEGMVREPVWSPLRRN